MKFFITLSPFLLMLITTFPLLACGFKAEGLDTDNVGRVHSALSKINSEFELDLQKQEIHFTSEEAVSLEQVQKVLSENGVNELAVKNLPHRGTR